MGENRFACSTLVSIISPAHCQVSALIGREWAAPNRLSGQRMHDAHIHILCDEHSPRGGGTTVRLKDASRFGSMLPGLWPDDRQP